MKFKILGWDQGQVFDGRSLHIQVRFALDQIGRMYFTIRTLSRAVEASEVIRPVKGGVEVDIMVTPNAKQAGVGEVDRWRKRLVVKVKALPSEGRANKAVIELLSEVFGVRVEIVHGHTERHKTVLVPLDLDAARACLEGI